MKKQLEKFNLDVVETHGLMRIDFEKYDIIDFSYTEDDVFYKNKKIKVTATEYLSEVLRKGYGVFLDDKVYYLKNLAPDIISRERRNFESYVKHSLELRKQDRYGIQKYLVHPDYEILVKNAMQFYDRDFDIDFVKKILKGRVKDVDIFLNYLENRKNKEVS